MAHEKLENLVKPGQPTWACPAAATRPASSVPDARQTRKSPGPAAIHWCENLRCMLAESGGPTWLA
jgi:hypothetical protein